MGIITTQDIEKIVQQYADSSDGDWYFIVNKEFLDGIDKWLWEYSISEEGWWLNYQIYTAQNEEQMYILRFYNRGRN